ncbi:MAG: hypothetical protein H0X66_21025 [Verrucomicrobia bacterium]|nr:hypothetical protein [Verrucomicrobiota bacterium]
MKLFISLFTLFNSSLLLLAQDAGQTGGGTVPAGQQPAGSIPAQTTPAQTSPVQSPPVQTSPLQTVPQITQPGIGGPLDPAIEPQRPLGSVPGGGTEVAPGTSTPADAGEPIGVTPSRAGETPSGVERLDPGTSPMIHSVPPPVRDSFRSQPTDPEITDPSGAARSATQRGFETGVSDAALQRDFQRERFGEDDFSQQFQLRTSRPGVTQMAFPQENAMVTIVSQDGILRLQGTVSDEQQRQNIEREVRRMSSAGFIDNQLRVVPRSNQRSEQTPSGTVR